MSQTRRSLVPFHQPMRSRDTAMRFAPIRGWTDVPQPAAPLGSTTSAQNCWMVRPALQPRWRLAMLGNNVLGAEPTGAFPYDDIEGVRYEVIGSTDTFAYRDGTTWTALGYVSGTSNHPPTGGIANRLFGTTVYLERADLNLALLTNGVDPVFAWGGPSTGTAFSTLTQGPICTDLALFDNSPIAWNIQELSSSTRFVTRVQWPVGGDPEDWTGIGSGFEDLLDMRGPGTRIFVEGDELLLASTEELYIGRRIGGAFRFQFTALNRTIGMPLQRAAIQTPLGIFWLNNDYLVYRYSGRQIEPVGVPIQERLRREGAVLTTAFFGWNPVVRQITLYYAVGAGSAPTRGLTYDLDSQSWMPQRFAQGVNVGLLVPQVSSSGTTWGALVGTFATQSQTYNEMIGSSDQLSEGLISSTGSVFVYSPSASSDDGTSVTHMVTLPLPTDNERMFQPREVRLRVAADSASSLSVGFSGNGGVTVPQERGLAISASSEATVQRAFYTVTGHLPALQLQSTGGDWRVMDVFVRGSFGAEQ